ncbi:hypothetical protein A0H81_02408 [Grifola frondosa]|uniref:Uncharacterized protein n=1 Tax=Grifola frondosa TaxID=5627 RepID=A0A1C7MME8_GRIFR|nr:hypothetical protein A0H81_02408 [Grifola frondosa]
MSLRRVGGKGDGGVDLQGWWWLPTTLSSSSISQLDDHMYFRRRMRVLAQCKAEKKKISPRYIREMEGVLHRYLSQPNSDDSPQPDGSRGPLDPIVGLFISESPFSKSTLLRVHSSPIPLALLHIPPPLPLALPHIPPPLLNPPNLPDLDLPSSRVSLDDAESDPDTTSSENALGTLIFNAALGSSTGLLQGAVEPRWEHAPFLPLGCAGDRGCGVVDAGWTAGRQTRICL